MYGEVFQYIGGSMKKTSRENKELIFSVTEKDFKVEFSTANVKAGGSGKDTSNTAVRIFHPDSGAEGISKDERSQSQNKKIAFNRLVESDKFKNWHRAKTAAILAGYEKSEEMIEDTVETAMDPKNIKVETKIDGKWKIINNSDRMEW
jgi:protein subunit release factor B